MPEQIVLFDLGRRDKPNTSWSANVWKTRLVLNYKNIPYTTHWENHVTLGPTLESLGVPPNISGQGLPYTVPTMKFPDGTILTDSAVLVKKLEDMYPSPSLNLDEELEGEAYQAVVLTSMPLFTLYMPHVARNVIEESTVPAFEATRQKKFGMSIADFEKKGGEHVWVAAEPGFAAMKALLTKHKRDEGPFIHGSQVCYADFILVSAMEGFKRVGGGMFERVVAKEQVFSALYDASRAWVERAD